MADTNVLPARRYMGRLLYYEGDRPVYGVACCNRGGDDGGGGGGGGPVATFCCPDNPTSSKLNIHVDVTSTTTGDLSCIDQLDIPIDLVPNIIDTVWESYNNLVCGDYIYADFRCFGNSTLGHYLFNFGAGSLGSDNNPSFLNITCPGDPDSIVCSPFEVVWNNLDVELFNWGNWGYSGLNATGKVTLTITETGGGPPPTGVVTSCCPAGLPSTIYLHLVNSTGCAALNGVSVALTWGTGTAGDGWYGSDSSCGAPISWVVTCPGSGSGSGVDGFYVGNNSHGGTYSAVKVIPSGNTCSPLLLNFELLNVLHIGTCDGYVSGIVTESP